MEREREFGLRGPTPEGIAGGPAGIYKYGQFPGVDQLPHSIATPRLSLRTRPVTKIDHMVAWSELSSR